MGDLPHAVKVRLVTHLAQFAGPTEAARLVTEEFSVPIDRRTAWKYDAARTGCRCGHRYRELFWEVRERWLTDIAAVPITHLSHRLRVLDRLAEQMEAQGDLGGALRAIRQAAEEMGGMYGSAPR